MLHHLVPDEVEPGSLAANLAFYEPRTAHGSSLSPAIHAGPLARAGEPDRALELFRLAARLDLDDLTGTTAGGLHLATMGGVWQALAYGFLGLRPGDEILDVDPCLPDAWDALTLRFRFRGDAVGVRADHDTVTVSCTRPLLVRIAGGPPRTLPAAGRQLPSRWERPMRTVLAALDASAAARPVLETALGIGELTGADGGGRPRAGRTDRHTGVARRAAWRPAADPRRAGEGLAAGRRRRPCRDRGGVRRTGHPRRSPSRSAGPRCTCSNGPTSRSSWSPPRRSRVSPRPFRRLLVPLEGSEQSSRPVAESLCPLIVGEIELVVLHVFTKATVPRTLDRPERDLSLWARRVPRPLLPRGHRASSCAPGRSARRVAEVCGEQRCRPRGAELVAGQLAGSRRGRPRRARTLQIPVLLLPVDTVLLFRNDETLRPVAGRRDR